MKDKKRSISLAREEVELLLSCLDTSSVYLQDCSSRFKLLNLKGYISPISSGISKIANLSSKFSEFYSKFDNSDSTYFKNDFTTLLDVININKNEEGS